MRRSIGTIAFTFFAGLTVVAQGSVAGWVTDEHGAVWPGAKITLSQESNQNAEVRQTTTDSVGEYSFANVPFGNFRIQAAVSGVNREFTKRIELNSKEPIRIDIGFTFAPCSDEEDFTAAKITTEDQAEIVRSLISNLVGKLPPKPGDRKVILSPANFSEKWISAEQRSRISILSREKIQELTEKEGELVYFTISKPTQRGNCVGISLINNLTVKGQLEDANMAGGSDTYEFRKVDGKWTGLHLSSTIS